MVNYRSGTVAIEMEQHEPAGPGAHPGILVLHGSGGAGAYWMDRFAPTLMKFGVAAYAPHYLQKTGSKRATAEMILDGKHFPEWLAAIRDAVGYVAQRPAIDARRIRVLGVSLGGYPGVALGIEDRRIRAVIELSGGLPTGWEEAGGARDGARADSARSRRYGGSGDRGAPAAESAEGASSHLRDGVVSG